MKKYIALGAMAFTMIFSISGNKVFAQGDQGVQVLIDEKPVGLVTSRQAAHKALEKFLDFPALNARIDKQEIAFENQVEVKAYKGPGQEVLSEKELYTHLKNLNKKIKVKAKGTWQDQAEKYGLDLQDLLAANEAKLTDPLPEEIFLPTMDIQLKALSKEEVTYQEVVSYQVREVEDENLTQGKREVVQKGQKGQREVKAKVERLNGEKVQHIIESATLLKDPVDEVVHVGTKQGASGSFMVPTQGRLSSPFGPRWGRFHRGIDLACPVGTPVVAADGGTITRARTNAGSYGNYIDVDHGNGYTTRYAHLSQIEVQVGQKVVKGQEIAKSGNTGRSTGPHLHFEVCNGGKLEDPLGHISL